MFKPGSKVCHRKAGAIAVDVTILQPALIDELWYQVEAPQKGGQNPVKQWIRAADVEPSANTADWSYGWWNLQTQEYEDPLETHETEAVVESYVATETASGSASGTPEVEGRYHEAAWRERVKEDLAAQVEAGGRIYGDRGDGAYVVRTKDGDQITTPRHAR